MTTYVFFLDIDDTILYKKDPASPSVISDRVVDTMKAAREKGHYVFINTGRAPSYFDDLIRSLPVDGYVCGCGAYVLIGEETVYRAKYPSEAIYRWMKRLSRPGDPGIVAEGEQRIFRYRNSYWTPKEGWILSDDPEDYRAYQQDDPTVKASICNDLPEDRKKEILEELKKDFNVIHHPTEHYTECCAKGCSKATGMELVMKHYGLDLSRSVAIGDSENDLDMITAAGIGIVMGQARDEIKRYADRITDDILHDGAATAMEALMKEAEENEA